MCCFIGFQVLLVEFDYGGLKLLLQLAIYSSVVSSHRYNGVDSLLI
jgi:hypothetical protein